MGFRARKGSVKVAADGALSLLVVLHRLEGRKGGGTAVDVAFGGAAVMGMVTPPRDGISTAPAKVFIGFPLRFCTVPTHAPGPDWSPGSDS